MIKLAIPTTGNKKEATRSQSCTSNFANVSFHMFIPYNRLECEPEVKGS